MGYLIIGFVLLLIIAPIFAILPSARQKEQMRLRKRAMDQGISVELTRIEDPIPRQDKYMSSTGRPLEPILAVAAYRIARPKPREWRISAQIKWVVERQAENSTELPGRWHWDGSKPEEISPEFEEFLSRELSYLPDDVVKIQEVNSSLVVYWHESSSEEGLAAIVRFLQGALSVYPYKMYDDLDPI